MCSPSKLHRLNDSQFVLAKRGCMIYYGSATPSRYLSRTSYSPLVILHTLSHSETLVPSCLHIILLFSLCLLLLLLSYCSCYPSHSLPLSTIRTELPLTNVDTYRRHCALGGKLRDSSLFCCVVLRTVTLLCLQSISTSIKSPVRKSKASAET